MARRRRNLSFIGKNDNFINEVMLIQWKEFAFSNDILWIDEYSGGALFESKASSLCAACTIYGYAEQTLPHHQRKVNTERCSVEIHMGIFARG